MQQLVNHMLQFYQDEQADPAHENDYEHRRVMVIKQRELAQKVMAKAKELGEWDV